MGATLRASSSRGAAVYAVDLPPEPPDRAVVLDREAVAWQRRDDLALGERAEWRWFRVGVVGTLFNRTSGQAWRHFVVDRGPLAPMIAESALEDAGWRRAGYDGPGCEVLDSDPGPHGSTGSVRFGPSDGWWRAGFDAPDCELFAPEQHEPCAMTAP